MNLLSIGKPKISESDISRKHGKPKAVKGKNRYIKSVKKKTVSGRKCKICGKDASPNYFFCPPCHYRINAVEETDVSNITLEEH
jgi:uncharacterized OB-fold protein